jgi:hypothetical protein
MTETAPQASGQIVRFERSMTIDARFAGRTTVATLRYVLLRPGSILRLALTSFIVAVLITLSVHPGGIVGFGVYVVGVVAFPALYVLIFFIAGLIARKQIRERLPIGSEYSLTLSDDSMRLKDQFVAADVSYKLYKSVRATKDLVALNPRRGRRPTLIPRELFTAESLAWLESKVGTGS